MAVTPAFFAFEVLGNRVEDYFLALVVFALMFLVLKFFKVVIVQKIKKIAGKTSTHIDDAIVEAVEKIGWTFYAILSIYIAFQFIHVNNMLYRITYYLLFLVMIYYVTIVVQKIITFIIEKATHSNSERAKQESKTISTFLGAIVKAALWVFAIIMVLDNFGFEVSTLIAGLGIGGLAIAFALQNILADLFASVSIYFDKPFSVGDFIVVGADSGVVEKIGIKTTRLRTLQGQLLVMSNKELTESRINNYKKMKKRRVVFSFGVTYDTSAVKVKKIPDMVKKIIEQDKDAVVDRVHFKEFGDSALLYEVVYYVEDRDYTKFMDTQQRINVGILERFNKAKIEMAFPTQTIHVKK